MSNPSATLSAPSATDSTPHTHVLTRRRVYILPTRHGLGFCLVALVMLLGAINYNNSLGYLLTFLLSSMALVSMLHAYRNMADLGLKLTAGEPAFAGEQANFRLSLDNRRQPARHDVAVSFSDQLNDNEAVPVVQHLSIDADSIGQLSLRMTTTRRGWFKAGRVTISTRFPFGLFRAWSTFHTDTRSLVYPRPQGDQPLPTHAVRPAHTDGAKGLGNDDFTGLRTYQPGDSTRRIHWKSVAKEQDTAVKLFSGANPAEVKLRWSKATGTDTEARLSQLTAWVLEADSQSLTYALELPSARHPAHHGTNHRQACLRDLALFEPNDA